MSRGDTLPGFPRARLPSHRDEEPAPEHVYQILERFDGRIGGLEESSRKSELTQATMLVKLESIAATDRHATTKLIVGLITTAITVIGGQRLLAPSPMPSSPPPVARTALDLKLDTCRPMPPGPSREDCFARVINETDH